ncbi:hypothetical protein SPIROBIBN47_100164 [uncultured spirochete]|uniref:Uncharacterized protein n=1 Tax=uncultured spirochete TaxID=156406 RepID=A0A3P3XFB8_9SPIR|nr:hypothetical protein SPIROBIBN47_100164 [uncultured spirochete]
MTDFADFGIVSIADCTVGVAQVVECQTVDLVVVGSIPITHPSPSPLSGLGTEPERVRSSAG